MQSVTLPKPLRRFSVRVVSSSTCSFGKVRCSLTRHGHAGRLTHTGCQSEGFALPPPAFMLRVVSLVASSSFMAPSSRSGSGGNGAGHQNVLVALVAAQPA
jgi:hypothetical protein